MVESLDDAIIGNDLDGIITDWNRGARRIFGYSAEEMLGTPIRQMFPEDRLHEHDDIIEKTRRGENIAQFETLRKTKDGRLLAVSMMVSPVRDRAGKVIGAVRVVRDITAQREREQQLTRISRLYDALSQVNQTIIQTQTRGALFERVCRALVERGGFRMAWIGMHDIETHELVPAAVAGDDSGYLAEIKIYGDDRPEGRGPGGIAFRTGQPFICNDVQHNTVMLAWRPMLLENGLVSLAAFPVKLQDSVCGVLLVYSEDPQFFQDKEINLLQETAGNISFALDDMAEKGRREQAEKTARNERQFSATMFESMPGVLYFYDEQGRFLRWNKNFEVATGYTGSEIGWMHPLDFIGDEHKAEVKARIEEVFENGESFVEASLKTKAGGTIPYFFTGRRILYNGMPCLVGMGIDISGRKQAEADRRTIEGRYRSLFEHAPDGILVADPGGHYLDVNASMCRMLGFARDDLIGMDATSIVVPEEFTRIEPAIDSILSKQEFHQEWRFRRKDGSTFPAEVFAVTMPDGDILAMIRDITDRKQAEQAQRALNENLELEVAGRTAELRGALVRAEEADRVKSAFLATMSHELRTPLNSIIGFTGIVLQGLAGPLSPEQEKQLGMVRNSARHLLDLINDVLDISKIEAGQLELRLERVMLRDTLEKVTALVRPLAEKKGISLDLHMPAAPLAFDTDRRRLEQILLNLLNNAIKFTEHGRVTLSAEPLDGRSGDARRLRLRVKDTGIGIRSEDIPRLFQPFRQVDTGTARLHEGTGLGLAICRRLAEMLGGEITVSSTWNEGSEFTVTLPIEELVKA